MANANEAKNEEVITKAESKPKGKVTTKASKRKYCSTEYRSERRIEDLLDREDQHNADLGCLYRKKQKKERYSNLGDKKKELNSTRTQHQA